VAASIYQGQLSDNVGRKSCIKGRFQINHGQTVALALGMDRDSLKKDEMLKGMANYRDYIGPFRVFHLSKAALHYEFIRMSFHLDYKRCLKEDTGDINKCLSRWFLDSEIQFGD